MSLWQTDDTRTYRPSVLDEVRNGLYYFESTLFDLAPEIERRLGEAQAEAYPDATFETDALRDAALLSVNGIAAGLRNTG